MENNQVMLFGWTLGQWSKVHERIPIKLDSLSSFIKARAVWLKSCDKDPTEADLNEEVCVSIMAFPYVSLTPIDTNIDALDKAHIKATTKETINITNHGSSYGDGGMLMGLAIGMSI